jgi:CBS domain-containing protein
VRLGEAVLLMVEKGIRRLLVVDKGKLVVIVTQKDIMHGTLNKFLALSIIR